MAGHGQCDALAVGLHAIPDLGHDLLGDHVRALAAVLVEELFYVPLLGQLWQVGAGSVPVALHLVLALGPGLLDDLMVHVQHAGVGSPVPFQLH